MINIDKLGLLGFLNFQINLDWERSKKRWFFAEFQVIPGGEFLAPSLGPGHSGVEYDGSMYIFAGYDGNYRTKSATCGVVAPAWLIASSELIGFLQHPISITTQVLI